MELIVAEVRNQVDRIIDSFHLNDVNRSQVKTQIEDITGYEVVMDSVTDLAPNSIAGRVLIPGHEGHPIRFMFNVK